LKPRDVLLLFVLAALWGASFIYIRYSVHELGPFVLVATRTLMAAAVLLLIAWVNRREIDLRQQWKQYLVLGLLNSAIPFVLISAAEESLTAPLASILNATTPLWGAVVSLFWAGDKLTPTRIIGLLVGLLGVSIVVGTEQISLSSALLGPVVMMLTASLFYALGTMYGKTTFKNPVPLSMAIGQQLAAGMIMLPFAVSNPPTGEITPLIIVAMLLLGILSTAAAYLLYFRLLASAGPINTMTVTFLVPFFSILWGAMFLNEFIGWQQFVGLLVILVSLFLVTGFRPSFLGAGKPAPAASGD
jgi:drug/metabolite transporter (DMT)-like permease